MHFAMYYLCFFFYALYNAFIDWTFFCTLEGNRTPI